ncbi:MAG: sister chromatid cohesion protein PDS5 [Culturomica sp.]|nr:sister chromatid cohesion protein PDS5 [Culturomica sp.]
MRPLYNIYCDESCHLENDGCKSMVLGAIWCPDKKKDEIFRRLREIKVEHGLSPHFELKWNAVSPSKLAYYLDVVNYFFDNSDLHFRTLVVPDKADLDHVKFRQTHDDFYYKMYFSLLKTIFEPDNSYNVYIDIKDTRGNEKVKKLHEALSNTHYDFSHNLIRKVQQVRSHEVELIGLADFFTGAEGYVHRGLETSTAKIDLIAKIRERSGYSLLKPTLYKEDKFNVFIWKSGYGKQ